MLIDFTVRNYRSFRDASTLSMEALGYKDHRDVLIAAGSKRLVPAVAVLGKNGSGKTNLIRAAWLANKFICGARIAQTARSPVPVRPFELDEPHRGEPTSFEFTYVHKNTKYVYGFSATRERVVAEYLHHYPNGRRSLVFSRDRDTYRFTQARRNRQIISTLTAPNQLFLAIAESMNDSQCAEAAAWFRDAMFFAHDYEDLGYQLARNIDDRDALDAMRAYARLADVGIDDLRFEVRNTSRSLEDMSDEDVALLMQVLARFSQIPADALHPLDGSLQSTEVAATALHEVTGPDGKRATYSLSILDESDGTRNFMAFAPGIEAALRTGGVFWIDEIEKGLHPRLVDYVISKFQDPKTNAKGAQLVFTTHSAEVLEPDKLRKDQLYFVDKNRDGSSELYMVRDIGTRSDENLRRGYLAGRYGSYPNIVVGGGL